jgi:Predicted transcription regulator containing HTH domain
MVEGKMTAQLDIRAVASAWQALTAKIGIKVPQSEQDYDEVVAALDMLLDATHGEEHHDLGTLIDLLAGLVTVYESRHLEEIHTSPSDVLRLLMESNGLRQTDLAEELGGQSVVSALLHGKRQFNARQAAALSHRFGVSASLFIAKPSGTTCRRKLVRWS